MRYEQVTRFEGWRDAARRLLVAEVPPDQVVWSSQPKHQTRLSFDEADPASHPPRINSRFTVPRQFLKSATLVACHREPRRWELMYRLLWRLLHGEPELLQVAVDEDVHAFHQLEKSVRRDEHKMHAFVRFRRLEVEGREEYIAWHRPDHHILRLAAPFFVGRFAAMHWTIMTPDETAIWDTHELRFAPGVPRDEFPADEELEQLWRTYYSSTFNPARLNVKQMKREMPQRYWPALPEADLISTLVERAPQRVGAMLASGQQAVTAADFVPRTRSLKTLAAAARECQGCPLYGHATQTVFGEGPRSARLVFVGEQPGDSEDLEGRPFVGPAGRLFDRVLADVGIDRSTVYVTNAVKHFKWTPHGKRRLHAKPSAREMTACRPWLEAELDLIKPDLLVCLGATAAQSLLGRTFKITEQRGQPFASDWSPWTLATYHPSAVLRTEQTPHGRRVFEDFRSDLQQVAEKLRAS